MLKPYCYRPVSVVAIFEGQTVDKESVVEDEFQDDEPTIRHEIIPYKLSNSGESQIGSVSFGALSTIANEKVILKYQDVFPYVPKSTSITVHDIDAKPIKQHLYHINPEKCKLKLLKC